MIWHTIESYRNDGLGILAGFLLAVKNCLLQKLRIHVPSLLFRSDENRLCSKISDRMG